MSPRFTVSARRTSAVCSLGRLPAGVPEQVAAAQPALGAVILRPRHAAPAYHRSGQSLAGQDSTTSRSRTPIYAMDSTSADPADRHESLQELDVLFEGVELERRQDRVLAGGCALGAQAAGCSRP